jgi:hypothetical protein
MHVTSSINAADWVDVARLLNVDCLFSVFIRKIEGELGCPATRPERYRSHFVMSLSEKAETIELCL